MGIAMRPPAEIKDWLPIGQMFQWLQEAPNEAAHKRRMAIWLTHTGNLHAHQVADILGISTQAVWLWIRQYNQAGPAGLQRHGRGGRRWGFLTAQQEAELLAPLTRKARAGHPPKPAAIRQIIQEMLGRPVSMSYVYRLLSRHNWADTLARSRPRKAPRSSPETFAEFSQLWQRDA